MGRPWRSRSPKRNVQFWGLIGPLKSIVSHCCVVRCRKINNDITAPLLQQTAMLPSGQCHITLSPTPWNILPLRCGLVSKFSLTTSLRRATRVAVVGCRDDVVPSELVWLRRSRDARRALVGCRRSDDTWLVECRNATWVGLDSAAGNCPSTPPGDAADATLMHGFPHHHRLIHAVNK